MDRGAFNVNLLKNRCSDSSRVQVYSDLFWGAWTGTKTVRGETTNGEALVAKLLVQLNKLLPPAIGQWPMS